ncbi:hypothetical protein ZIOFF_008145 [Zingiber officinale]|uniref:Subtilisin-like protease fibronectin type-III domain-containing protein n=1 Tax=Zingiber officinale TaxID=94328 RepID=A0A8J5IHR2_ZINOF|nr:hypothetical protein ZIOFF_008145 [Zingiber officinale]
MYPSAGQDQLSYGAGQLNPVNAVDPGLVYNAGASDYVQMLCDSGYNETMIGIVTGDSSSCSSSTSTGTARDLNYPSMALHVQSGKAFAAKFLRTVTNVGSARPSKYKAEVRADRRLNVVVNPSKLRFSELNEKRQFTVSVSGGPLPGNSTAPATVIWSDGKHLTGVKCFEIATTSKSNWKTREPKGTTVRRGLVGRGVVGSVSDQKWWLAMTMNKRFLDTRGSIAIDRNSSWLPEAPLVASLIANPELLKNFRLGGRSQISSYCISISELGSSPLFLIIPSLRRALNSSRKHSSLWGFLGPAI